MNYSKKEFRVRVMGWLRLSRNGSELLLSPFPFPFLPILPKHNVSFPGFNKNEADVPGRVVEKVGK